MYYGNSNERAVYHGTTKDNAQKIKEKGFIASSKGRMGPGVYFTGDYQTAYKIASHRAIQQGKQPEVIKSYVNYNDIQGGLHPKWNKVTESPFGQFVCKQPSVIKSASEYLIYVKSLTGATYDIEVRLNMSIQDVMRLYADKIGDDFRWIRLIFQLKQLDEYRTLSDYNISYGDTLHAVIRLR